MPQFKVDLHTHTNASSDGRSTLAAMIGSARERGLDAILISDHNVFALNESKIVDGILAICGCEISTSSGHILALFCKPFHVKELRKASAGGGSGRLSGLSPGDVSTVHPSGLPSAEAVIDAVHANGGIAVVAHPFQNPMRKLDSIANMLDGVECANARVYMKNKDGNEMARAFAEKYGLFQTGGSDAHHKSEVGNCYTVVEADSLEEVECAIRAGRTAAVEAKKTRRTAKGLSQMTSAWRSKKIKKIFKASLVLAKGIVFDLMGR